MTPDEVMCIVSEELERSYKEQPKLALEAPDEFDRKSAWIDFAATFVVGCTARGVTLISRELYDKLVKRAHENYTNRVGFEKARPSLKRST